MSLSLQPAFNRGDVDTQKLGQLVLTAEENAGVVQQPDIDVVVLGLRGAYVLHRRILPGKSPQTCRSIPAAFCRASDDVVPADGIEPPTFGLQNRCSTN